MDAKEAKSIANKKKVIAEYLRQRVRWLSAAVLVAVVLGVGAVFASITIPFSIMTLWHSGPGSAHAIEDTFNYIMVGLQETLGIVNQVGNTSYHDVGGYDIGFGANESVVAGMRLFTTAEGERILGFLLQGGPGVNTSDCGLPPLELVQNPPGTCPSYYVKITNPFNATQNILVVDGETYLNGSLVVAGTVNASGISGSLSCGIPFNEQGACDIFECSPSGSKTCVVKECHTVACLGGTCIYSPVSPGCASDGDCMGDQLCNTSNCTCYAPCVGVNCAANNTCGIYECRLGTCILLRNDTGCCNSSADCSDGNTCDVYDCINHKCFRANPANNSCSVGTDCLTGSCNTTNCTCYDACAGVNCDALGDPCTVYECRQGACYALYQNIPGCCWNNSMCDDGLNCTTDTCNQTTHTCIFTPPSGGCSNTTQCAAGQFCDPTCACITPLVTSTDNCVVKGLSDQTFFTAPRNFSTDSSVVGLLVSNGLTWYQWHMGKSVSISGDWLVATAPYLDTVFVYKRNTYGWAQTQTINRPSNSTSANYGVWANTVAVHGSMMAIGHCSNGTLAALPSGLGLISIYTLSGSTWSWSRDLNASFMQTNGSNEFCISGVDLFYSNSSFAVLAADDSFVKYIYIIQWAGGTSWTTGINYAVSGVTWTYLHPGSSAVSHATGTTAAFGGCSSNSSCEVLFFWSVVGWSVSNRKLINEPTWDYNPVNTSDGSQFGFSIGIYEPYMVVGAPYLWYDNAHDVSAPANRSGAAVIYTQTLISNWAQTETIYNPEPASLAYFGYSAKISNYRIAVGSPGDGGTGSVWVYLTDSPNFSTVGRMKQQVPQTGANYGNSVWVATEQVATGAYLYDTTVGTDSGAVFVVGCTTNT